MEFWKLCPETSVMNYQFTLPNIPEERISTLHTSRLRCRSGLTGSHGKHLFIRDCTVQAYEHGGEISSNLITFVSSLVKTGQIVQWLKWHKNRQHRDHIKAAKSAKYQAYIYRPQRFFELDSLRT
jgi:hypothetical protein